MSEEKEIHMHKNKKRYKWYAEKPNCILETLRKFYKTSGKNWWFEINTENEPLKSCFTFFWSSDGPQIVTNSEQLQEATQAVSSKIKKPKKNPEHDYASKTS
jgi:uncharacterized FlaG/YvyC family protein